MISDKLKEIREQTGMNKKEFASYMDIKYTTYNGYETGTREPASDFLIQISKKFDVSIDYMMGLTTEMDVKHSYVLKSYEYAHIEKYRTLDKYGRELVDMVLDKELERISAMDELSITSVPILGETASIAPRACILPFYRSNASAGNGIYQVGDTVVDYLYLKSDSFSEDASFIIKVSGESMAPNYHDDDMVMVAQMIPVHIGDVGIFVKNGDTFIKERGEKELISRNPDYPNIPIDDSDNVVCLGKVLGVVTIDMIIKRGGING